MNPLIIIAMPILWDLNKQVILNMLGKRPEIQIVDVSYPHKMVIAISGEAIQQLRASVQEMAVLPEVKLRKIMGAFLIVESSMLTGWAYDPDTGIIDHLEFEQHKFDLDDVISCELIVYPSQTVVVQLVYSDGRIYGADLGTAARIIEQFEAAQ